MMRYLLLFALCLVSSLAFADPLPSPGQVVSAKVDAAVASALTIPGTVPGDRVLLPVAPPAAIPAVTTTTTTSTNTRTSTATVVMDPSINPLGFWDSLSAAYHSGNYRLVVALLMILLIFLARKAAGAIPRIGAWFKTDRGGAVLALSVGVLTALAASLKSSTKFSVDLIVDGLIVGVLAGGGWSMMRRILPASWFIKSTPEPAPKQGSAEPAAVKPVDASDTTDSSGIIPVILPWLLVSSLFLSGCISAFCKKPENVHQPKCQLQSESLDCGKALGAKYLTVMQSGALWSALISNGTNWMADIELIAANFGPGGWEAIVCEASAIKNYIIAELGLPASSPIKEVAPAILVKIETVLKVNPRPVINAPAAPKAPAPTSIVTAVSPATP